MAALSESLAQHRDLLEETKHQRTALNTTVASLAQEKADILREKVTLEVRIESTKDTMESLKRKLGLVTEERDRLQEAVKDSEKRVFLAELNRSVSASRDGSCTRDSGTPICSVSSMKRVLPSLLPHADDARHEQLLKEYRPLCETVSQLREREAELSSQLQELGSQYEARLRTAREHHGRSTEKIKHKHNEVRERWKVETEELRKKLHDTQIKMQAQSMELQTAKKTVEEREREKAELMKERDTLQKELEAERQRGDEAREHLASVAATHSEKVALIQQKMERETEKLLNGQNELLSNREELRTALEKAEERNCGLEQSLTSTTGELEEHLQKLSRFDAEVERLQQSLLECQQEKEMEVRGVKTQLAESRTHCQRLQREKEGLESALVSTQSKCSSLESELLVIKGQLSSVTTQLDSSHLSQNETDANYRALLAAIEHTICEQNPLHMVESAAEKPRLLESPEAVTESLVRMKNERDALREGAAQTHESLEQLRAGLKSATEEREEAKATVQHLQSSLQALQAKLDQASKNHEKAVVQGKENESRLSALQSANQELKINISSLKNQVKALSLSKETLKEQSALLEERLKEAEKANKARVKEVLKLTNTVTVLKSSQVNRDRAMAELEEKLRATQREVVQGELNLKTAERKRLALEQTLARFEQQSLKQENTKREMQLHARHVESQLKEIKEKSQGLRHELTISEAERETLRGDVEQLSVSLQSATRGKESLASSQEREIGRLRGEVERQLQENSVLKRELVQSTSSIGSISSSLVDGLISPSVALELHSSQARNFLPTPPSASSTPRKPANTSG